jgi:DNA modification methylase
MPRISEKSLIIDQEKYTKNISSYHLALKSLEEEFKSHISMENSRLVNFAENFSVPKHNWLRYKEGYASQLVINIIRENSFDKSKIILDPFCGVGTTNLVAQENGIENIGFDINPIAILASKVKTHHYSNYEIREIRSFINSNQNSIPYKYKELPKVLQTSYTTDVLNKILMLKYTLIQIDNENVRSFLNLAFISIVEDCSIRVKDGNGIKLKKNKVYVSNVFDFFKSKVELMLNDIQQHNYNTKSSFFEKSSIHFLKDYVEAGSVSLSIFSPPYANCFDYLEVYKLEVWLGGFANDYNDFSKYRNAAMRSHVNSGFDHTFNSFIEDVDIISELISSFNIWNKNIPDMIRGYFDDMNRLLSQLYITLAKGGKVYIIIANSVYKGVIVPTDLLISRLAKKVGFEVVKIGVARKIRASSQQIPNINNDLMRESIIELIK